MARDARRAGQIWYEHESTEFGRVVSFTDAVVAIAMTLLVLAIDLPRPAPGTDTANTDVFALVGDLRSQLVAFVLSFAIIGIYWFNHHRFFARLRAVNGQMLFWTLAFLLALVFVPFEAQLIGFYSSNPEAITLYAAWFVVFGALDIVGYQLARRSELFETQPSPARARYDYRSRLIAPTVFLVSIPIAYLVTPEVATWSWVAIWPISTVLDRGEPEA